MEGALIYASEKERMLHEGFKSMVENKGRLADIIYSCRATYQDLKNFFWWLAKNDIDLYYKANLVKEFGKAKRRAPKRFQSLIENYYALCEKNENGTLVTEHDVLKALWDKLGTAGIKYENRYCEHKVTAVAKGIIREYDELWVPLQENDILLQYEGDTIQLLSGINQFHTLFEAIPVKETELANLKKELRTCSLSSWIMKSAEITEKMQSIISDYSTLQSKLIDLGVSSWIATLDKLLGIRDFWNLYRDVFDGKGVFEVDLNNSAQCSKLIEILRIFVEDYNSAAEQERGLRLQLGYFDISFSYGEGVRKILNESALKKALDWAKVELLNAH